MVVVAWFVPVKSPPADLDNIIRDPTKGLASCLGCSFITEERLETL